MAKFVGGLRGQGGDKAAAKVLSVIADLEKQGYSKIPPFPIGKVEKRMEEYAAKHGIELPDEIYMTAHGSHSIAHAMRDEKAEAGKTVDPMDLAKFARYRANMDLYYDKQTKNFTYTDGKNKFILFPSETLKISGVKVKKVGFLTAQKLNAKEVFNGSRFDKIKH